jgi:hypothetical protein
MFGWWRRLASMPDGLRARRLAAIAGVGIVILLYTLGGLSLYARAHLLGDESALFPQRASGGSQTAPVTPLVTLFPTLTAPPPTVFPTMTPRPGLAALLPALAGRSALNPSP